MYIMYVMYVMYVCKHGNCMLTQAQHANPMWNQFRETQTWKLHANPGKLRSQHANLMLSQQTIILACESHVEPKTFICICMQTLCKTRKPIFACKHHVRLRNPPPQPVGACTYYANRTAAFKIHVERYCTVTQGFACKQEQKTISMRSACKQNQKYCRVYIPILCK